MEVRTEQHALMLND